MIALRPVLALLLALAVLAAPPFATAGQAGNGGCHDDCRFTGDVTGRDDSFYSHGHQWTSGGSYGPAGGYGGTGSPAGPGPYVEYDYRPICDAACQATYKNAMNTCLGDAQLVWVAQRTVNPPSAWDVQEEPICLTAAEQLPFDPAQLQAMVDDYFQRIPLPAPALNLSPADNAVVNLPEILSTDPPVQSTFTVDQAPFPTITISATVRWLWDFGDGETLAADGPGRPFDARDPDTSHYLTHTFRKASRGYRVFVTAVWTASYTVAGMPGTQQVAGQVRRVSTRTIAAADYGGTLTGN